MAKKPCTFVIFQGGPVHPVPSGSVHDSVVSEVYVT